MNYRPPLFRLLLLTCVLLGPAVPSQGSSADPVQQEPAALQFSFEGVVRSGAGALVRGAVVVSSAGGEAVTDEHGSFRLHTKVPTEAEAIQITAVGGPGGKLVASQLVSLPAAAGAITVAPLQLAQSSGCSAAWLPTFGGEPGVHGDVFDLRVFDDGNGKALYLAGDFSSAIGTSSPWIVKWDGTNWSPLGSGLNAEASVLEVFDDGNGARLIVAGEFTTAGGIPANHIAAWNGTSWAPLGSGVDDVVNALTVFDDGGGDELYVGGQFAVAGGVAAARIAKWDSANWASVGTGVDDSVFTLGVFDPGTGERLYVGGKFLLAGGVPASRIASWDGSTWAALGTGVSAPVYSLAVFNGGGGQQLYVGGQFNMAGGSPASMIASWDGASWSPLGLGLQSTGRHTVNDLTVWNDGTGEKLFACGEFRMAGFVLAENVAAWDGTSWSALAAGTGHKTFALATFDDGTGERLFAGGVFSSSPDFRTSVGFTAWDGSAWSSVGSGLNYTVQSLATFDDGNGPAIYAGGRFQTASGGPVNHVARWNGSSWTPLGSGMDRQYPGNSTVYALAVFDDGGGEALYAGGVFNNAGGVPVENIARWDGSNWSAPGTLGSHFSTTAWVSALHVFDSGSGARLVAAGRFQLADGLPVPNIAEWDGAVWTGLGGGTSGDVSALEVFDDGSGAALYAGGLFALAGGVQVGRIAKWDGAGWSALGSGLNFSCKALTVYDDGGGDRLVAGGFFTVAGGQSAKHVAAWDGSSWTPFGSGLTGVAHALATFDSGSGQELMVGGLLTTAGGIAVNNIAKWDGVGWAPLSQGLDETVVVLAVLNNGVEEALYVGGIFGSAPDSGDSYLAKWGCEFGSPRDFCNGDGGNQMACTDCPCMNNALPGTIGGCLNSALSSSRLFASGHAAVNLPPNDANDLRFVLTGAPANVFCLLNSGDAVAPTNPVNPCFGLGSGAQALSFDGLRCAVTNTRRHGGRPADGNGEVGVTNSPWGGEGGPPVGIANAGAGFVAGQTRFFQVIHRDDALAQCMRGLNTSQAVSVTFSAE